MNKLLEGMSDLSFERMVGQSLRLKAEKLAKTDEIHLSPFIIKYMAQVGGYANAALVDQTHLSTCPHCFALYAKQLKVSKIVTTDMSNVIDFSTYYQSISLPEAADSGQKVGFRETSEYFLVTVTPIKDQSLYELKIQVIKAEDQLEGEKLIVYLDGSHKVFLEGIIKNGQVSCTFEAITDLLSGFKISPA